MHDHSDWSEAEIRQAFNRFDANRSGKLDYRELRHALRALGADVGEAEATRVLQEFDRNKDGVLSLDEFRRLVQQRQRAAAPLSPGFFGGLEWSEKEIRHAFSRFDANSSGKLDYKELRQALRALGADVEHAEAVSVLQSCMPE